VPEVFAPSAPAQDVPATEHLDIRDPAAVHALIHRVRPDAVIHTAAGRDDWRAMADGAAHVALAAASLGARLVHVSTEAIFSGRETAVRAIAPTAAVVRTSLILGDGHGAHELLTHALITGQATGVLCTDQIRKPIHVDDLADALLELAAGDFAGVLNVAGPDPISRYDLGVLVARRDGLDPTLIPAGTAADLPVHLPVDLRLRTEKAASVLRTRVRGPYEFLSR
jgi:dTDP-4-dehydrorhamnose reductase